MKTENNHKQYILGYGLSKNIELVSSNEIRINNKTHLNIDSNYVFLIFVFDKKVTSSLSKESQLGDYLLKADILLDDLAVEDYFETESQIHDQSLKKFFLHYLYENHRISLFSKLIEIKDYKKIGQLMKDSFNSYKNYVKVSSQKEEYLFILADMHKALGTNISCKHLICLVEKDHQAKFTQSMIESFYEKYHEKLLVIWGLYDSKSKERRN